MKPGLKSALYYLLRKFASIIKGTRLMENNDAAAAEIDKFLDVLALNKKLLFGDATYILNRNRQMNLRRPQALPSESDVTLLKTYTLDRISTLLNDPFQMRDQRTYAELRDLTVSRLTLFNARRGGEPARMTVSEWMDGDNNAWLRKNGANAVDDGDDAERKLFHGMKIAYQTGKGNNSLVSVYIPQDMITPLQTLSNKLVRDMGNVRSDNNYLFPPRSQIRM